MTMRRYLVWAPVALFMLTTPAVAHAYLGPGLGLGAIGVALGVVGSILLGIVSVIWYPFKRLIRRIRRRGLVRDDAASADDPVARP